MNTPLQAIYEVISAKRLIENPLTSTEIEIRIAHMHDYFQTMNAREQDDAFMHLYELGQQKAFEAGFYTAVDLLLKRN